ncbi:MAG TPA: hypothetical protein VMR95_03685 [Candidatus Binatia bacterium]|nr:hypothetical protein [Candidatus Binatia bacterium]
MNHTNGLMIYERLLIRRRVKIPSSYTFGWLKARRVVAGILLVICVVLIEMWWNNLHNSPSNVFWGMIENNLNTTGATVQVNESSSSTSISEHVQFELGARNIAQATTSLNESQTTIKTETISTPTVDYTRYTDVGSKTSTQSDKNILNVWVRGSTVPKSQMNPLDHLLGQAVLGVVPFANLTGGEKQSLVNQVKSTKVYTPDLSDVIKAQFNGQAVYVYKVEINPKTYAGFMQKLSQDEGMGSSSEFNPSSYSSSSQPINVVLSIMPSSRQLLLVNYGNGHTEAVSDYGAQPVISAPSHTISVSELASRLAAASSSPTTTYKLN